jgi:hypothetical protein
MKLSQIKAYNVRTTKLTPQNDKRKTKRKDLKRRNRKNQGKQTKAIRKRRTFFRKKK